MSTSLPYLIAIVAAERQRSLRAEADAAHQARQAHAAAAKRRGEPPAMPQPGRWRLAWLRPRPAH